MPREVIIPPPPPGMTPRDLAWRLLQTPPSPRKTSKTESEGKTPTRQKPSKTS